MPIIWPAGLPQEPLYEGYEERVPDTVLRSQMDAGPPKLRRRFTAGIRAFAMAVGLTKAQVATLDTFYVTTTSGGSVAWEWKHPRTAATVNFRFVSPPRYRPRADDVWEARLDVEILP